MLFFCVTLQVESYAFAQDFLPERLVEKEIRIMKIILNNGFHVLLFPAAMVLFIEN